MTTQPEALKAQADFERHYTIDELSECWHLSARLLRRWFRDEPGVLTFGPDKLLRGKKKTHKSLRIPASVAKRVYTKNVQSDKDKDK